jgi:hypothetical protein
MMCDTGRCHRNYSGGITPYGTEGIVIPPETEIGSYAIVKAYPASGSYGMLTWKHFPMQHQRIWLRNTH